VALRFVGKTTKKESITFRVREEVRKRTDCVLKEILVQNIKEFTHEGL
jgi:hypothetical protein